jgi:hypothetical protein
MKQNPFSARPWYAGIICALIPIVWLWTKYPIYFDSRTVLGKVISVKTIRNDIGTEMAGGVSTVNVPCFELHVNFGFEVDHSYQTGIQTVAMCDWPSLIQLRKKLVDSTVTVVYSSSKPECAFVTELFAMIDLKVAAALSVALLILVTWAVGVKTGRYKDDALNVPLSNIQPRFVLVGLIVILFYACIFFI